MIADLGPHAERERPLSFHLVYAIWLFGIISYFIPAATWSPVSRFSTTRAMVELRTLTIDAFAASTGDRALRGGHWYSDKAPLPAIVAAGPYALYRAFDRLRGGEPHFTAVGTVDLPARHVYANDSFRKGLYISSVSTAAVSGAALGVLLFGLLRRRAPPQAALVASVMTVLGTPILPYATSFYGHVPSAALLFGALSAADPLDPENAGGLSARRARMAGACLAGAVGCEYLVAVPAVLIGAWILLASGRHLRRRTLLDIALGAALPVLLVSAYHAACFGAPWRTGYSFIARPEFAAGHASGLLGIHLPSFDGLYGLSLGVRRGLFYVSPVAAVGVFFGVVGAFRSQDPIPKVAFGAGGILLWMNAGYYMWWGGASAGPRHLVPALGALAFGIARAWNTSWLRPVVILLGLVSFANCLVLTAVGLEAPEQGNVLTEYAYPLLLQGRIAHMSAASNLGIELGLAPSASLGPVLAWVLVGFRFLIRKLDEEAPEGESHSGAEEALN